MMRTILCCDIVIRLIAQLFVCLLQKWKGNSKNCQLMFFEPDVRIHYFFQKGFRLLSRSIHFPVRRGYLFSHEHIQFSSNISFNLVFSFSSSSCPFSFFHFSISSTALLYSYLTLPLLPHVNDGMNLGISSWPKTLAHIPTIVPVLNDVLIADLE